MKTNLFQPARLTMAYAKVGLLGFAGSGKTRTAWEIAKGLHKALKSKKPIAFMDTETGSDFILRFAEEAKIELVVSKSRAFETLVKGMREAEDIADIIIIDSVTHYWVDLVESYKKKKNTKRLAFQDWAVIKPMWGEFSTWYVSSNIHVIVCGRAGFEYDYFRSDNGDMELYKTGTKMKAESEFGFEPSLLIEMDRIKNPEVTDEYHQAKGKDAKEQAARKLRSDRQWVRRAFVLKDRTDVLDGKFFDNPTYAEFAPHWSFLNLGGEHKPLEAGDSQELFDREGKPEYKKERERCQIALEEIEAEMIKAGLAGSGKEEKRNKIAMLEWLFGTSSWASISAMKYPELHNGLQNLRAARQYKPFDELVGQIVEEKITLSAFQEKFGVKEAEPDIPLNPGNDMIHCPNMNVDVAKKYCETSCKHREGCPLFG